MLRGRLALLAFAALSCLNPTHAVTRNERGALKLLFWATGGQRWANKWDVQNERSDPCLDRWYGIVCDQAGHIRAIRLPRNGLVGVLPPEFPRESLGSLHELDLGSNFLTGYVPDTLSRLAMLRTLRLDQNNFVGAIPASLGKLVKLEYLELQGNSFDPVSKDGILPDEIQQLTDFNGHRCHIIF